MPSVVPTNHTAQDAQDVRDQAEGLLDRVRTFSFSHEVELLKSKLLEVIAVAEREVDRVKQFGESPVKPAQTVAAPETPAAPAEPTTPVAPADANPADEKQTEEAAAAERQSQAAPQGAMTTQNTVTVPPEQISGVSDQEPENKVAGQPA